MKVILSPPLAVEAAIISVGKDNNLATIRPKHYASKTLYTNVVDMKVLDEKGKVHCEAKLRVNVKTGELSIVKHADLKEIPCPLDEKG